jgi:hypothetical protein
MKNPYGNYVIQKALKLASGFYKGKLINYIKKSIEKFSDKKLVVKWNNILSNLSSKKNAPPKLKLNTSETHSNNSFTNMSSNSPNSACSNNSNISSNSYRPTTSNSFRAIFLNNPQNDFQPMPQPNVFNMSYNSNNNYCKSSTNSPVFNSMTRFNTFNTKFSNSNSNSNSSRNNMNDYY